MVTLYQLRVDGVTFVPGPGRAIMWVQARSGHVRHGDCVAPHEASDLIRPFRLWDMARVARLQREGVPLDLETHLTRPRSPLGTAVISHFLPAYDGVCTCIADHKEENGGWSGFAQMRQRPGRNEYVIAVIAPALASGSGAHAAWQRLLAHLAVQAGERGGQRLYAGLPGEGEEYQIFRHMGFTAYAEEEVYQFTDAARLPGVTPLPLRRQRERDSWGLQKLYAAVTPRVVQAAEGSGQGEWELNPRRWPAAQQRLGYVWEVGGDINAVLHIRTAARVHWIRSLLHPDMRDQGEALASAALAGIKHPGRQQVFWAVRSYEAGLAATLHACGFEPVARQTLVVKHCTVRVREPVVQPVGALNGKAEHAAHTIKYND